MPTIPRSDHIASSSTIDHNLYRIITIDGKCVTASSWNSQNTSKNGNIVILLCTEWIASAVDLSS